VPARTAPPTGRLQVIIRIVHVSFSVLLVVDVVSASFLSGNLCRVAAVVEMLLVGV
jgi:hypothetical protein